MYEAVPGLLADDGSVRVTALPHGSVDTFYRVAGPGGRVASREEFADHVAGGAEGATVAPRRCAPGGHAVNTALQGHALADDVRLVGHLSRFPLPFEAAQ